MGKSLSARRLLSAAMACVLAATLGAAVAFADPAETDAAADAAQSPESGVAGLEAPALASSDEESQEGSADEDAATPSEDASVEEGGATPAEPLDTAAAEPASEEGSASGAEEDAWYNPDATEYTIATVEDMMAFAEAVNGGATFSGKVVKLGADIDLSGVEWAPIGEDSVYFAGEFDGQGHVISNLTQNGGARMGLFGLVENAYLHDFTLKGVSFTVSEDDARVGAVAGNLQYWNVLEDITIDGISVTTNGNDGLIGSVAGYVWKSQMGNVDVKSAVYTINGTGNVVGGNTGYGRAHVWDTGVVGNNDHWLEGSVQTIDGTEYVLQNYWVDCDVNGITVNLNGTGTEAGGFFGSDTYNSHSNYFVNCHVADLKATAAAGTSQLVGGFIAWNNGTTSVGTVKGFDGCSVTGKIIGASGNYGGFAGQVGGRACEYNNATADVEIVASAGVAGGFVGITQAYSTHKYVFNNCTATGDVTGGVAGGFAGKHALGGDGKSVFVDYNDCVASGEVTGFSIAGGLIGEVNTELPATNWNIVDSTGYLNLTNNTAADYVFGGGTTGALIGYLDGVANGDAKEGNKLIVTLIGNSPEGGINLSGDTDEEHILFPVAKVGSEYYETLAEAVAAANEVVDADNKPVATTVELIDDVVLGEKLTVSGNVAIKGAHTITRSDSYTGTLFAVNAGATLTLDGDLTIDGGNEWTMDVNAYNADLASFAEVGDGTKYFTPEEGAPVASAHMITVSGEGATVNLNEVTIKNHYAKGERDIVSAGTGATVNLSGATITHNAITSGSGLVVNASSGKWDTNPVIWVNMNEGTVIDGNHVGGNHGVFKVYMGTVFTMNGGSIKNTTGWNSNGVAVGVYWATFNMIGGEICSNSSVYGPNNGRNAAVYGHSAHTINMAGGSICHNSGGSRSGLDAPYADSSSNGATTITGGYIGENSSYYHDNGVEGYNPDITAGDKLTITGGTFTQDVSQWLAPDTGLAYDEETGKYSVVDNVAKVGDEEYASLADAVAEAQDGDTIVVTRSHKVGAPVVIDKDITLDLNGNTVWVTESGVNPVFRIVSDVTVKNGTVDGATEVDDALYGEAYAFIVGASDGSAEGNLTIESGTYHGAASVASVTKGALVVNGGDFSVVPWVASEGAEPNYQFLLNCIDDNYKDGSASISVKGGTFRNFDPANNAAEGAGTNFVAAGYESVDGNDGAWTVLKKTYVVNLIGGENFTIDPSGDVEVSRGDDFSFAVKPADGYRVLSVVAGGQPLVLGSDGKYTIEDIQADVDVAVTVALKEAATHTVTYMVDGAVSFTDTVETGKAIAKPADPTKEGYTFDGWFLDDVEYDFSKAVTSDITLVAKFTENKPPATDPSDPTAPEGDKPADGTESDGDTDSKPEQKPEVDKPAGDTEPNGDADSKPEQKPEGSLEPTGDAVPVAGAFGAVFLAVAAAVVAVAARRFAA